ncbi:glycosyltransferase family 2 protein [Pseudonocardia sp. GCM10023141]|uniref:glycosyltransferase family 2 protein n=1 Tax=Pseudonocardia sp. GCM10023141 TaxID=3252653 RepID=UPI00360665B8
MTAQTAEPAIDPADRTVEIHAPAPRARARTAAAPRVSAPRVSAPKPLLRPRSAVQPSLVALPVVFVIALSTSLWAWQGHGPVHAISWVTTVMWTLPVFTSLIGTYGGLRTVRRLRAARRRGPTHNVRTDRLVVVIPTIGRYDTLPALDRVVRSCARLAPFFPDRTIDIVIEEGCAAEAEIRELARTTALARVIMVPARYRTPNGTKFKARANHYAHVHRIADGEARDDVWVLHLDDDTGVDLDTAEELARFVGDQRGRGADALHLTQGVLTYPREHGTDRLVWLADAVRPACDISTFAATTGRGTPRAGLHGELLLVRASIEAGIGWDFGPRAMVEDAQFALEFTRRHPGRSDWFPGRCLGATPVSVKDFVTQRERWAWGLLELAANRRMPLRSRLLLIHNMIVWACGPLQHVGVVLLAGGLLGQVDTLPVTALLLPVWAVNIAYQIWSYWEGLKINVRASADPRRIWWESIAVVALMPLFSLWEAAGVLRGFVRFIRHDTTTFTVIAKPR